MKTQSTYAIAAIIAALFTLTSFAQEGSGSKPEADGSGTTSQSAMAPSAQEGSDSKAEADGSDTKGHSGIAVSAEEIHALKVGEMAPRVMVRTVDGESVPLAAMAAGQPTAVIFYRGGWCPYCNTHLKDLRDAEPRLKELGYKLLAISPDRPEELRKTAEKQDLGYTLLSDSKLAAAKAFGIAFQVDDATLKKYAGYGIDLEAASGESHHALPVPAVFLVDPEGVIRFSYANADYKVRLDNHALLSAASQNAPSPEGSAPKQGSDSK